MVDTSITASRAKCPTQKPRDWAAIAILCLIGTGAISAPLMVYAVHTHRENVARGHELVEQWQDATLYRRLHQGEGTE